MIISQFVIFHKSYADIIHKLVSLPENSNLWCRSCHVRTLFICIRQFQQILDFSVVSSGFLQFSDRVLWSYTHWAFTRMFLALRETNPLQKRWNEREKPAPLHELLWLFHLGAKNFWMLKILGFKSEMTWRTNLSSYFEREYWQMSCWKALFL